MRNFRNYAESEIHFSPRLNVFHGDNAQGKTNLLEAIYLVATGRSFRSQHLSELIREKEAFFYLEAALVRDGVAQTAKISFDGQNRRLQLDGNSYDSFHPLLGTLPSVLYTPNDTELINGSPSLRRRFLNFHLAQSDPLYVHHLTRYWRAMKQRNCLLRLYREGFKNRNMPRRRPEFESGEAGAEAAKLKKFSDAGGSQSLWLSDAGRADFRITSGMKQDETLDCWEAEMAQSAAYLLQVRQEMADEIKNPLEKQSRRLSAEKETHELRFQPTYPPSTATYLQQLQKNRSRERDLGFTLTGPHRDDLSLYIEGKPARLFASEGQKKTAIAALKLAEWERLCQRIHAPALMGIDDLGLHLDETRQKLLRLSLDSLGQVFVTTPHLPSAWQELAAGKQLLIANGAVA